MSRRVLVVFLAMLAGVPAIAQQPQATVPPATQPLPVDAKVRIGTLPNGLRYYIRQNAKPEKRAELRLVVNAGAVLEDDDQLGLAHFLEHTAFNGTTNFKKNDLVSYLESIGVRFGADLNAYTGFDETVYILPVPTDSAHIVDKAFQILEDWAHGQIFDPTEVTNERGIVVEEWRGRKGAGERMLQQWLPVALKGSRYATRLPIGTKESIESANPERLRRFYQDWYRPDLMAVIAVGDFDPARIETIIKQRFSGIAPKPGARPRTLAEVPDNRTPLVAIATDREATSSSVDVIFKLVPQATKTVGDYRRDLVEGLYLGMLNNRFAEISRNPDAPFLGAGSSKGDFYARSKDAFSLSATVKDGGIERGLEALLTEAKRVDQFGFLESELARQKQAVLRAYERSYAERDKTVSGSFVDEYIGNFLDGEAIPGIDYEYQLTQQLMPTITLQDVNRLARDWITDENRVIIAEAPLKDGLKTPTEAELLAVFNRMSTANVVAWVETLSDAPLLAKLPAPGRVVSTRSMPAVGLTEWKLSNGARVLIKPTDFKADEVLFNAYSEGGTSLASNADFMSAALASQIIGLGGLGEFNRTDLGKKLTGKAAGVGASIGATSEGLSGRASPKDMETLFQLIHLQFTAPRLDSVAFRVFQSQVLPQLENRGSSPEEVFGDTVQVTMGQHHFRARPITPAVFSEVDIAKSYAFFKDRFADAGDFTFVFVGNVALDSLKPLVERYIATLPTTGRKETWKAVTPTMPKGVIQKTVRKGTEPKATTMMAFTGPFVYTPENRFMLRALTDVFQIKLNETLREQLGGTYSPSVGASPTRVPNAEYMLRVDFESSPENVEKLTQSVLALVDTLKAKGPSVADVEKVKEQFIRGRETELKTNAYWIGNISGRDQSKEDIAGLLEPYDRMVRSLTPAQVQQAARLYFDTKNYARFVLLPESIVP
jgi:zinc protease